METLDARAAKDITIGVHETLMRSKSYGTTLSSRRCNSGLRTRPKIPHLRCKVVSKLLGGVLQKNIDGFLPAIDQPIGHPFTLDRPAGDGTAWLPCSIWVLKRYLFDFAAYDLRKSQGFSRISNKSLANLYLAFPRSAASTIRQVLWWLLCSSESRAWILVFG